MFIACRINLNKFIVGRSVFIQCECDIAPKTKALSIRPSDPALEINIQLSK